MLVEPLLPSVAVRVSRQVGTKILTPVGDIFAKGQDMTLFKRYVILKSHSHIFFAEGKEEQPS